MTGRLSAPSCLVCRWGTCLSPVLPVLPVPTTANPRGVSLFFPEGQRDRYNSSFHVFHRSAQDAKERLLPCAPPHFIVHTSTRPSRDSREREEGEELRGTSAA